MGKYEYNREAKEASVYTKERNKAFAEEYGLDLEHGTNSEYELAKKGCIKRLENYQIQGTKNYPVWDLKPFDFLEEDKIADTVHPSLWLNGKSNYEAGVFEVIKDKIYQVRGLDIANITFVRSKTGWIVLDVTTSVESAAAGISLLEEAIGESVKENIRAVIISHSHLDHFGGIKGVVDENRVGAFEDGKVPIIVPYGFDIETVKENVYAGTAMFHRSNYQFGESLKPGAKGRVSNGLGLAMSKGTISYIRPTNRIKEDTILVIDGLEVEFQLTPGTEAPSEMNNYFPEYRAFWAAENCTGTLHNLYPIRGAQVRDSANWWRFTEAALEKYGNRLDVVFQSHNWPHANTPEQPQLAQEFLRNSAAVYKYIHDKTLLLANQGHTAKEIAREIKLPEKLAKVWYTRPYYGSLEVNVRAIYNKYLGFYNGNPVNLFPLSEVEEAKKFVEYVGSEDKVLDKVEEDFAVGNYQWAAKAANYVVYTNPFNERARILCADSFEQLAYQSESSIWRCAYLVGAQELRASRNQEKSADKRKQEAATRESGGRSDLINNMTTEMLLDYLGILIDGDNFAEEDQRFRLQIINPSEENATSTQETVDYLGKRVPVVENYLVHLYHGTILYYKGEVEGNLPYVRVPEKVLLAIIGRQFEQVKSYVDTNCMNVLERLNAMVTDLNATSQFPLVEPR